MKKIIKILLILTLIILLLLIINLTKNFFIIEKNIDISKNSISNINNYHVEIIKTKAENQSEKIDMYYKDAKYLINEYKNDIIIATYYKNYKNNKDSSVLSNGEKTQFDDSIVETYSLKNLEIVTEDITIPRIVVFSATCLIKNEDKYIIVTKNGYINYYNKETGFLEKRINNKNNEVEEISMEINIPDDKIVLK